MEKQCHSRNTSPRGGSFKTSVIVAIIFLVLTMGLALPSITEAAPLNGFWQTTTANYIAVAFYTDMGLNPHYGAFFSGQNGYGQHFLGPGGDGATSCCSGGIANWNWWGGSLNVLLLPKSWLLGGYSGSWTASNYQAILYFN